MIFILRFTSNVNCYPVAKIDSNGAQNQRLDIYKRQNSEFNRLQSNQIDYSAYENINDEAPIENENDINTAESRRFGGGLKKRPCVPVYPDRYRRRQKKRRRNDGGYNGAYNGRYNAPYDGRTLYDLNLYFLGYQPNHYQVNPATQTVSAIAAVDGNRPVSSNYNTNDQYDHYGGYYDCEPNPFYHPPLLAGGIYNGNGAYNDDPNRPSYLGLLGQGLFDFVNGLFGYGNPNAGSGGYDTPVSAGAGSILNDPSDEKPVYEINVPDTIAALVNYTYLKNSNHSNPIIFQFFPYRIQITGDLVN